MRAIVFTPDRDQKPGDYTGAFEVEAQRFVEAHQLPPSAWVKVDISQGAGHRREQVLQALGDAGQKEPLTFVAFLCHGWRDGIQLGFTLAQVPLLASYLASHSTSDVAVMLYACSTAEGDPARSGAARDSGSFASVLYGAMTQCVATDSKLAAGCHVDGHTTAGHCTSNPYVRRTDAQGSMLIIGPSSPLAAGWKEALADRHHSTLRFRFPLMTVGQIEAELQGGG